MILEFYRKIVIENGYDLKIYLFNFVYNFGHMFDSLRDVYLFLAEDPRGRLESVSQAGYSLGQTVFFFITADIAEYHSDAVPYEMRTDIVYLDRIDEIAVEIENLLAQ